MTFVATVAALDSGGTIELTVTLDVPKLDVEVQQVHNVTSDCAPAQASTPSNQVYQNLTQVVPSIGFDAFEVFTEEAKLIGFSLGSDNQSVEQNFAKNLSTACYFFDTAKETLGSVPAKNSINPKNSISPSSATSMYIPFVECYAAIVLVALLVV